MTFLTRALRPAVLPAAVATAVLAVALTGCATPSANSAEGVAAAGAPSTTAAAPSSAAAVSAAPIATHSSGAVINPGGPMRPAGDVVYFAEGGDVRGTTAHEPSCAAGCPLSGDGTALLSKMTWSAWTGTKAVGTGTEKIDDCSPNCATGKLYPVKVTVTLTKPVHVCVDGTTRWYWSRLAFAWPDGLPAAFKGANAPTNPLVYSDIASQSKSCA
jgi:hypothetical protein